MSGYGGYGGYGGGYGGYSRFGYGGNMMGGMGGMGGMMDPNGSMGWLTSVNQMIGSIGQITEMLGMNAEALNFCIALVTMATAPSDAPAPKKPWRFYYVLAFPLSQRLAKKKLTSVLELTDSIERFEEEYVAGIADRNGFITPDILPPSPLPRYAATMLLWTSALVAVSSIAAMVVLYMSSQEDLPSQVVTGAYATIATLMAVNWAICAAVKRRMETTLRALMVVLVLLLAIDVVCLDEASSIFFSQEAFLEALNSGRHDVSDNDIDLVLNGGRSPSLWHRYVFDGPACTQLLLVLMVLSLGFGDDVAPSSFPSARKTRGRRRPHRRHRKGSPDTKAPGWSLLSLSPLLKLSKIWLALVGIASALVGATLLTSCSFVGPAETWALALAVAFGSLQLLTAVLAAFDWRRHLVRSVLIGSIAFETYLTSALASFIEGLLRLPLLQQDQQDSDSRVQAEWLRATYDTVYQQTCPAMRAWRRHVCVVQATTPTVSPLGQIHAASLFDAPTCRSEFSALLVSTADRAHALLLWTVAAQWVLLVPLILPGIRDTVTALAWRVFNSLTGFNAQEDNNGAELKPPKASAWRLATIEYAQAKDIYMSTVRQRAGAFEVGAAPRLAAEQTAFDKEWAKMAGAAASAGGSGNAVFQHQFEAIVRVLVLRRLTQCCKLDVSLSLSSDGKLLLVKIFASDNLLMTTLCQRQGGAPYKLQLTDAIDPGPFFWKDRAEINADQRVLDRANVLHRFKLLQLHGIVTRKEAELTAHESLAQVSARVHALSRLSRIAHGKLRCPPLGQPLYLHTAAYAPYRPHAHLQYLYRKYPTRLDVPIASTVTTAAKASPQVMTTPLRRSAVLRTIDCLRFTRQIIDTEFDVDLMLRHGLITAFAPLHSASRYDCTARRETLLDHWVAFWRAPHLPGEWEPSQHWVLSQLARLSPFRQPLRDIRDYFGECIAFYFAWLACYNQYLLIPSVASVILLVEVRSHASDPSGVAGSTLTTYLTGDVSALPSPTAYELPTGPIVLGLATLVWGLLFIKFWERRSVWHQLEWGMTDLTLDLTNRVNFRGEIRRNPATQQLEVHFPGRIRIFRQVISALALVFLSAVHVVIVVVLLVGMQGYSMSWIGLRVAVIVSTLAVALLVEWNGDVISAVAHQLSEWENYQNEVEFQRSVILKVFLLQAANTYVPLWLIAFGYDAVDQLPGCQSFAADVAPRVGSLVQLQLLLFLLFVTRITSHVLLIVQGVVRRRHQQLLQKQRSATAPSAWAHSPTKRREVKPKSSTAKLNVVVPSVEAELALEPYGGCFEDYTEIVVQFGLVVMFSGVFPLTPLFSFVACALELRLDALDLCVSLRRPTPDVADSIGPWDSCLLALIKLGLLTNLGLIYFASSNHSDWPTVRRMSAFLVCAMAGWLTSEILLAAIPTTSGVVRTLRARHEFILERYMGSSTDKPSPGSASGATTSPSDVEQLLTKTPNEGSDKSVAFVQERVELLHRLDVALRKPAALQTAALLHAPHVIIDEDDTAKDFVLDDESRSKEGILMAYLRRARESIVGRTGLDAALEQARALKEGSTGPESLVDAEALPEGLDIESLGVDADVLRDPRGSLVSSVSDALDQVDSMKLAGISMGDAAGVTGFLQRVRQSIVGGPSAIIRSIESSASDAVSSVLTDAKNALEEAEQSAETQAKGALEGALSSVGGTDSSGFLGGVLRRVSDTLKTSKSPQAVVGSLEAEASATFAGAQRNVSEEFAKGLGSTFEPTALSGLEAIHQAAERDGFDFEKDLGWQQPPAVAKRASISSSIAKRFSLFKGKTRRGSVDGSAAMSPSSEKATVVPPVERPSVHDGSGLPVVELSGLDAVQEAARRSRFDFSSDRTCLSIPPLVAEDENVTF
ncbi:hypothetical protein P43SY_002472 [Pythium insidiosum]|uniref:Anoctamin transmembrane domain-containing protein n=1 Tax=Pythium insidiosum TaxID=114742 RepID=A0AAD5LBV8_PYTIN|nr:hypothetical protein P43SY_002472 [Pythium insidiosum]